MDTRVAPRYAKALFLAAKKANALESVSDDVNGIADAIEGNPRLAEFMANPTNAAREKVAMLERVFADRVTALTMSFLRLMANKKRESMFGLVRDRFNELKREADNLLAIQIESAFPLAPEHEAAIVAKIERATGKTVVAEKTVNPALIAGVRVHLDGFVMDGTASGNLSRLRETLVYDLLKQS